MANNDFFPVDFADQYVADNEQLKKTGRFGKWVADNRRLFVILSLSMFLLGFISLLFFVVQGFMPSMRMAAAGVAYQFGQERLAYSSVTLPSGLVVERVIQPVAAVTDQGHAMLLIKQMQSRKTLTLDTVRQGYSQWLLSVQETLPHNFTWTAAKVVASSIKGNDTCLCYMQLGLPFNAVLLNEDVLYEPVVEKAQGDTTVIERGSFYALMRKARVFIASSSEPRVSTPEEVPLRVSSSAMVQYITESGRFRRSMFEGEEYRCIRNCIAIYNDE